MCGAKADLGILSMQVHQSSIERGMIAVNKVSFTHSPMNPGPPSDERQPGFELGDFDRQLAGG